MWIRYRFYTTSEDYRPIQFNPAYPWWKTGESITGDSTIVAYLPYEQIISSYDEQLRKFWPEAYEIEWEKAESIEFSERFPEPEYYTAHKKKLYEAAIQDISFLSADASVLAKYLRKYSPESPPSSEEWKQIGAMIVVLKGYIEVVDRQLEEFTAMLQNPKTDPQKN